MQAFSDSTLKYLTPPNDKQFAKDKVHLAATKSLDKSLSHFIVDFYRPDPNAPEGRRNPSSSTDRWARAFPESRYNYNVFGTTQYELPATDMVVERINSCFEKDAISFEDKETELVYQNVLIRGKQADKNAEIYAEYKEHKTVPKHSLVISSEYPLACYQQVGLFNLDNSPGYGLFMEQGTGKTPVGIAQICNASEKHYEETGRMYRALIVCPKNVRANWASEFQKFATTCGRITILHGTEMERIKQLLRAFIEEKESGDKYTVIICSYESMTRSWNAISKIMERMRGEKFDLSLLDESHYIKNERTKRYKHAVKLRDISTKRAVLTGTPITNTALDLYTQLEFLGKGYSGFYSFKAFRKFFAAYRMDQATGRELMIGLQNMPFMKERLARYSFFVKQKDVQPELPDRVYDILEVDMADYQQRMYEQLRDQLLVEAEAELSRAEFSPNRKMIVNNVLTKMLKLAQITSGFIKWSPVLNEDTGEEVEPARIDRFDPDLKLEALVELLKHKELSEPNSKTIIWSCWVQNIKTIRARLAVEGIDCVLFYGATKDRERADAEERFNCDPKCKVFVGNPAAGGVGLNLIGYPPEGHAIYKETGKTPDDWETNANHVIYYSQNWSPTARSQSEKRAHRRGTREPVRVTDLVVPGSIDQEIRMVVMQKQLSAMEIADLRKILNSILTGELIND